MITSKSELLSQAKARGFRPEILEKVYRLLGIFQQLISVPYLKDRLVLKGGHSTESVLLRRSATPISGYRLKLIVGCKTS